MPELPEVETVRADLEKILLNKTIIKLEINKSKLIKGKTSVNDFKNLLINSYFTAINRRGKLLIFTLNQPNLFLLVHLKMTGQLIFRHQAKIIVGGHDDGKNIELPNKHSHIIFTFTDHSQLFFNDQRQFGYMQIINDQEIALVLAKFGIEPLQPNFNWDNFQKIFMHRKTFIKAILLNQQLIAGLGNIYADEVCFASQILPTRLANSLIENEKQALWQNCNTILQMAITNRGTTFNTFVDANGKTGNFSSMLKVFGRTGLQCLRCKTGVIQKIRLVGRGTYFCDQCQF